MTWQEVQEQFPKSFDLLQHVYSYYSFQDDDSIAAKPVYRSDFNARNLYDFFDDNQLIIGIEFYSSVLEDKREFMYGIYGFNDKSLHGNGKAPTRIEAEMKSFLIAFEALERKLSTSNKMPES